jgi:hypothetical protein
VQNKREIRSTGLLTIAIQTGTESIGSTITISMIFLTNYDRPAIEEADTATSPCMDE